MTATAEHNHGIRHAHYHGHKEAAADMAAACRNWLDSLSPEQRAKGTFHYLDGERQFWYYPPLNRHGLPLRDMTDEQRQLAFAIMEARWSPRHTSRPGPSSSMSLSWGPWNRNGTLSPSFATRSFTTGRCSASRAVRNPGAGAPRDTMFPCTSVSGATR